jgi:hypothetical protein
VYAAISKWLDYDAFLEQLKSIPYIGPYKRIVSIFLPISELIIAFLLSLPITKKLGFYMSLVALFLFTVYIVLILMGDKIPCSCGGVISTLGWRSHIIFNLFFILLSCLGIKYSDTFRHGLFQKTH